MKRLLTGQLRSSGASLFFCVCLIVIYWTHCLISYMIKACKRMKGVTVMDCLFCKIVEGELPSTKVLENDKVLVFQNINPEAPVHVLIIPKKHIASMNDIQDEDLLLIGEMHKAAKEAAAKLGIAESGYRLINNCGPDGEQSVFHVHYHLMGGRRLGALTGISPAHI